MYKQILNYLNEDKMSAKEYDKQVHVVLMDINLLPSEYKDTVLKDGIAQYEKDFNIKLIPYDSSKINTSGYQVAGTGIQYLGRE